MYPPDLSCFQDPLDDAGDSGLQKPLIKPDGFAMGVRGICADFDFLDPSFILRDSKFHKNLFSTLDALDEIAEKEGYEGIECAVECESMIENHEYKQDLKVYCPRSSLRYPGTWKFARISEVEGALWFLCDVAIADYSKVHTIYTGRETIKTIHDDHRLEIIRRLPTEPGIQQPNSEQWQQLERKDKIWAG